MGANSHRPDDSGMGPASSAPDTDDGLYPDTDGDLAHRSDGDSDPLPNSNEPKTSGVDAAVSEPKQGTEDPATPESGLDDGLRPTGGNS